MRAISDVEGHSEVKQQRTYRSRSRLNNSMFESPQRQYIKAGCRPLSNKILNEQQLLKNEQLLNSKFVSASPVAQIIMEDSDNMSSCCSPILKELDDKLLTKNVIAR